MCAGDVATKLGSYVASERAAASLQCLWCKSGLFHAAVWCMERVAVKVELDHASTQYGRRGHVILCVLKII